MQQIRSGIGTILWYVLPWLLFAAGIFIGNIAETLIPSGAIVGGAVLGGLAFIHSSVRLIAQSRTTSGALYWLLGVIMLLVFWLGGPLPLKLDWWVNALISIGFDVIITIILMFIIGRIATTEEEHPAQTDHPTSTAQPTTTADWIRQTIGVPGAPNHAWLEVADMMRSLLEHSDAIVTNANARQAETVHSAAKLAAELATQYENASAPVKHVLRQACANLGYPLPEDHAHPAPPAAPNPPQRPFVIQPIRGHRDRK